jgi:hypothetical protein
VVGGAEAISCWLLGLQQNFTYFRRKWLAWYYRNDLNLVRCLPRLAVLVSIQTNRPGAWFPGIGLSRGFEWVQVPGNSMKIPFCSGVFWGEILAISICARRQPNHVYTF